MKLRDLEYLTAVANAGNFSRAARSLRISASTISRRVGRFEDELGLTVFERGHSGVRLTTGGRAVLRHARRAVAEFEAIKFTGKQNGIGAIGELRLGVRMPPIAEPLRHLLTVWRDTCPEILLTISEVNERDLAIALEERRLDVALATSRRLPPRAAAMPVYREPLIAALPDDHPLAGQVALSWPALAGQTILVQGWEESQAEREFLAPLLGPEVNFQSHAASRQSILALVSVGFGIAIVAESQARVGFPGISFRPIDEPNAWLEMGLAWPPEVEEPAVGRFVAFIRDEARSRRLL
jgi:DNA-binding transcriptional LysR family regulator